MTLPSHSLYTEIFPEDLAFIASALSIPTKTCSKCDGIFQLTDFYKNKNSKDGRGVKCKKCDNARHMELELLRNPPKVKVPKLNSTGDAIRICPNKDCVYNGVPQMLSSFACDSSRTSGHNSHCKDCTINKNLQWRKNNPLKVKEGRVRMTEKDPDYWNARSKKYRLDYPDRVREAKKLYRQEHPEMVVMERKRKRARELEQPLDIDISESLWAKRIISACKSRASKKKVPFDIKPSDLLDDSTGTLPVFFPIFPFIKLDYAGGGNRRRWASVDRIVPELGYIAGNVAVISFAANFWKNDGTDAEERKRIVAIMNGRKKKKEPDERQTALFN